METVYTKRFIKTEDDFPQKDGNYICHHYGMPETILDVFPYKVKESHWFVEVDWFLEPRELPTDEMIDDYFSIKQGGLRATNDALNNRRIGAKAMRDGKIK